MFHKSKKRVGSERTFQKSKGKFGSRKNVPEVLQLLIFSPDPPQAYTENIKVSNKKLNKYVNRNETLLCLIF